MQDAAVTATDVNELQKVCGLLCYCMLLFTFIAFKCFLLRTIYKSVSWVNLSLLKYKNTLNLPSRICKKIIIVIQ